MGEQQPSAWLIGAVTIYLCIEVALLFSMAELYAYRNNMASLHLHYRPWFVWLIHFAVFIPNSYALVTRLSRLFQSGR